ncbi:MAG: fatty acid hydroxylase, partial [Alphaproteobacteria bacterium]|nr:fatty acid hydroxylase [Alphaproteobacteria bacterium]
MFEGFQRILEQIQGAIFETAVQPALYAFGLMDWSEDLFDGIEFALYGALAVGLAYILFRPLELWRPVESWGERKPVRTDVTYTLI